MRFLLDTNICIYLIKGRPPSVLQRLSGQEPGSVGISSITLAELEYGVAKSARPEQNGQALARFAAPLAVAAFDDRAAEVYGLVRGALEREGQPIGPLDTLIAAHALSLDAVLVTNNEREFRRVPGLTVANWT